MPRSRFLALSVLLACLIGCDRHPDSRQIAAIDQSFQQSRDFIRESSDRVYLALSDKMYKPHVSDYTQYWALTGLNVKPIANRAIGYIDKLQTTIATPEWATPQTLEALFDTLAKIKRDLIMVLPDSLSRGTEIASAVRRDFFKTLPVLMGYNGSTADPSSYKAWADSVFTGDSSLDRLTLKRIENDIELSEYRVIHYCLNNTAELILDRHRMWPIVSVSSQIVKPGGTIGITAGMGEFSAEAAPIIFINNKIVPLTDYTTAISEVHAPEKPGRYKIPVKIEFTNPDGSKSYFSKTIAFDVSSCQSPVVADASH